MTTPDMEAIQSLFDGYTRTDANGWAKHCRALFDRCRVLEAAEEGQRGEAIDLAVRYGGIDGDHHKAWVIDQMVRALAGDSYGQIVAEACDGEDGPATYEWKTGIAP